MGQSTFIVMLNWTWFCAMQALKHLRLRMSCVRSEMASAQGIMAVTMEHLSQHRSSFMITTHFHKILEIEHVKKIQNIGFYHFGDLQLPGGFQRVVHSASLTYDRKLKPGLGNQLYGIEICQHIMGVGGFATTFIQNALLIVIYSCKMSKQDVSRVIWHWTRFKRWAPQSSRYNGDVVVDRCEICGKITIGYTSYQRTVFCRCIWIYPTRSQES